MISRRALLRAAPALLRAAPALLLAGCGGTGEPRFSGEAGQIAELIHDFEDLTNSPETLPSAFAAGAAPKGAAQKKYVGLQYTLAGKPSVSGDTATAIVVIEKSATGDKLGEKTWDFVKEGGTWKIKAAPLP